jgi:hypothetical protein
MWSRAKRAPVDEDPKFPNRDELIAWRQTQLIRTGFDPTQAASLATERAIDLHALIELVERGCPPPIAARILAPLDHERTAC